MVRACASKLHGLLPRKKGAKVEKVKPVKSRSLSYTARVALAAARAIENYFQGPPKRPRGSAPVARGGRAKSGVDCKPSLDETIGYIISTSAANMM